QVLRHDAAATAVAVSPDGRRAAAGSLEFEKRRGSVQVWELAGGKPVLSRAVELDGGVEEVHFSPDGRRLLAVTSNLAEAGQPAPGPPPKFDLPAELAAIAPDGKTVATAGQSEEDGSHFELRVGELNESPRWPSAVRMRGTVKGLRFSPDGRVLLVRTDREA